MSMRPVGDGPPERLALGSVAERRRALGRHAEALDVVVGEEQVVRARLDGHVDAARAGLGSQRHAAAGADVHDVQRGAGLAGQRRARARWRRARRSTGRDARKSRTPTRPSASMRSDRRAVISSLSAWTATGRLEPRGLAHAVEQRHVVGPRKLRQAGVAHERLEADDARARPAPPCSSRLPGTRPPHSAKSAIELAASAARLRSNSAAVTVQGVELSGMSKNVRAAAGRERAAAGRRRLPTRSGPAR